MGVGRKEGKGDCGLFLEVIHDSEGAVLGDDGEVPAVGGEGEGVDAVVGELPHGDGVHLLVLGVDRLVHVDLRRVVHPARADGVAAGPGVALVLGSEDVILLLLVVDNQRAVHVGREEEVLGAWDPFDLGDGRAVDDALGLSAWVEQVS